MLKLILGPQLIFFVCFHIHSRFPLCLASTSDGLGNYWWHDTASHCEEPESQGIVLSSG